MVKKNEVTIEETQPRYRYVCHGCTKAAGYFDVPVQNVRIVCPHCGKDQLTILGDFIFEAA